MKGRQRNNRPGGSRSRPAGSAGGITRRDFLNGTLLGAGALLLDLPAPMRLFAAESPWDGYGGTGDYTLSNGNTAEVVSTGHALRDGRFDSPGTTISDTGEVFDLVVIGGGLSGLGAAHYFTKVRNKDQRCLVIENHSFPGGESKRNEFLVNGQLLIGPQGSNSFVVLDDPDVPGYDIYQDLGVPRSFSYQSTSGLKKSLLFDRTNYGFMLWYDDSPSFGYFFENSASGGTWASRLWSAGFRDVPLPERAKRDLLAWRNSGKRYYSEDTFEPWLDTMTYSDYLEKIMGVGPDVARFVDPVLASSIGLGSDAVSAFGAYQVAMPGFEGFPGGFTRRAKTADSDWHSFPGGNDGFARHFLKRLIPDSISGRNSFGDIMNGKVDLARLDRPENPVSIRLGSLAVGVRHDAGPERSDFLSVTYVQGGKVRRLKARSAVIASGGWVAKRIVKDLPGEYRDAYAQFLRSPMLVVNVAVTNWRFLYKLGLTACRWFEGFGFSCNIKRQMIIGGYQPALDPDRPAVITFYVPFYYPGLPARDQGIKGRTTLLATSFADYEKQIRQQMTRLFGSSGFDSQRDIAGIILNRWGHAFVNPQPGFYFNREGIPAARSIIRKRFGRIAFGHSELNGHQHWLGAVDEGRRAAKQVMAIL